MLLFTPMLVLAACGHISNGTIEADAAFLSALPDGDNQALLGPDSAQANSGDPASSQVAAPERVGLDDAATTGSNSSRTNAPVNIGWVDVPLEPEEDPTAPGSDVPLPPRHGTLELPEWTTVSHDQHGAIENIDAALPQFAPLAQSAEMLDAVTDLLENVFEASDRLRETAPTTSPSGSRTWQDLAWNGSLLSGEIHSTDEGQYAWSLAGDAETTFVDGAVDARPTAETGTGSWYFDVDSYAGSFGVTASGGVSVSYDNRLGVELTLGLDGVRFPDGRGDCGGQSWDNNPFGVQPGWVTAGTRQSYSLIDEVGDYQFVTLREHACDQPTESRIRLRWTPQGGRADATMRIGTDAHWMWSQCWLGGFDPGSTVYELLQTWDSEGNSNTPRNGGDPATCVFSDFASVSAAVLGG